MNSSNGMTRVPLISLAVISVILLYSSIVLFVLKESEKDRKIAFQKKLEETIVEKENTETRLREMELAGAEMKSDIKVQEDKITAMTRQLDDARNDSAKNFAKMQEKDTEIASLRLKLDEEKAEKEDLLKRLEKLNEDYLNMKFQLESFMKTKEELEKKAKDLADKEGVSLGSIVIKKSYE